MFRGSKGKGKGEGLKDTLSAVPAQRTVIDLTVPEDECTCWRMVERLQAQSNAPPEEKAKNCHRPTGLNATRQK